MSDEFTGGGTHPALLGSARKAAFFCLNQFLAGSRLYGKAENLPVNWVPEEPTIQPARETFSPGGFLMALFEVDCIPKSRPCQG